MVSGEVGSYLSELKVYGHAEGPCPRCGTAISKITLAGRGTHFCRRCQTPTKKRK
jgi:formamidopyrimidine-DNA glycosylase